MPWGKTPTGVLPRVILLPYLTTNCSVHFEIDTFTHNDHDGYVQFSTNLTQKRLLYPKGGQFCMKSIPGSSSHYFIHWKHVRKYLQQICSSLLWISFAFDYICWLAIMYMCDFWCQTCKISIKGYLYKMILITQKTSSCVVEFK